MLCCRALTGAWIETATWCRTAVGASRRALTGAWIETIVMSRLAIQLQVASSRARGLKRSSIDQGFGFSRRALTGAWIETSAVNSNRSIVSSRPHGRVD